MTAVTIEDLRAVRYAKPFAPFKLKTRDGKSYPVYDSFEFAMTPSFVIVILETGGAAMLEMGDIAAIVKRGVPKRRIAPHSKTSRINAARRRRRL